MQSPDAAFFQDELRFDEVESREPVRLSGGLVNVVATHDELRTTWPAH
jgi:hypothetical protein